MFNFNKRVVKIVREHTEVLEKKIKKINSMLEDQMIAASDSIYALDSRVGDLMDKINHIEEEMVGDLMDKINHIEEEMESYKKYKTEKDLLKEGDEPWSDFQIEVTDDGRVKVTMDWNKPFIQYLKENGFNASSEEDMVSSYFSGLVREHGDEMTEEEAIAKT